MENRHRAKKFTTVGITYPRHFFTPTDLAIFDQANDAIFLHDIHTGAIVNLNKKACALYGYRPEEVTKNKLTIRGGEYPYTEEEALRLIKKAVAGDPQIFEWKTRAKSGREFWVEVNLKSIKIHNRELVLANVRDITRRKMTEQRLKLQHNSLTLLQDTALTMMNNLDLNDLLTNLVPYAGALLGTHHGFIYMANDEKGILELKVAVTFQDNILTPQIRLGESLVGKIWQTGEPVAIQNYATSNERLPDTTSDYIRAIIGVPLKSGSKVVGVIGLCYLDDEHPFRDDEITLLSRFVEFASIALDNARLHTTLQSELTERNYNETALRLSEERHRLLFNSVHDTIYVAEITDEGLPGKIIEINDAACRQLGYQREELLALTPADLIPFEHRGDMQEKVAALYAQKHIMAESVHITKNGQSIPVELNSHLLYLDNRPCILSIARDMTDRKQVEKEMARLDRLNLIGAMAAGIGHEIRNPLTTVRGFLQMLTSKPECARYQDYFELMVQELDRANSIITEFLSLAKNKPVDLRDGNLNAIASMLLPLLEAGAILYDKSVRTDLGDIPDIPLDEKEIRQLILNVVRNGLDAMPPGGTLTLKTYTDDNEIVLSIQDQGKGIPPDVEDKIGTPFFTTKEYGVGLGLAVCYSIAARHNAAITFDSCPTGTTFYIRFKIG